MDVNIHPIIDQLMRPRYHYALKCFDAEDRAPKVPAQPLRYSQVHAWEKKRNTYRYINIDKSISKYRTPCNHNICMNVIWIIITIYIYYINIINTHIFHLFYFQSRISQASSCEVPGIAPFERLVMAVRPGIGSPQRKPEQSHDKLTQNGGFTWLNRIKPC